MQTLNQLADAVVAAQENGSFSQEQDAIAALIAAVRATEQGGEAVAVVDESDDVMWANILPNRSVRVGQLLYAHQQPTQEPVNQQLLDACKRANEISLREFGMGLIDLNIIEAAETQLPAPAVPNGWQLVPKEPTEDMIRKSYWSGAGEVNIHEEWAKREVWVRMLAAAPQPAQPATAPSTVTDDELLDEFWAHAEVRIDGAIVGLVQALRAVEQLVAPRPKEGGAA
ncbi:hypothetical protein PWG14_24305 [Chromobacterium amazonense]|uniref:hypothetical protein n=1 Tax=Chromobacterium amazonense TaxID=1382803 RepID=UPI00237D59D8|nr:hypothetical protein [Chromobacterium amazonense]MDE1715591.1 hypothetical protein [Chromobacterium amazonense]